MGTLSQLQRPTRGAQRERAETPRKCSAGLLRRAASSGVWRKTASLADRPAGPSALIHMAGEVLKNATSDLVHMNRLNRNTLSAKRRDSTMLRFRISRTRGLGLGRWLIALVLAAWACGASAAGYYYGPRYGYDYQDDAPAVRQDLDRLRRQMQQQQRQNEEQLRLQEEQLRLLQQQQSVQQRITAMQACYYRFNAGLDLCEDLFEAESPQHAVCVYKVMEHNPACAQDLMTPLRRPES